ncbi:glycerol-3-phosphate acyltransferase [Tistrella bauzanensis]|uniref:Glycerol-3-phosphate acyltransferase n=1 Tax=Tistrella bauzanensis TaxID=657419 RepID=A0ABQ1J4Y7_9PROT|nr:glycerol-3-phosphate 1-O-acyltransferase PlsY [Tistrella bauzanensis]GGB57526.1 glycerol-3-phosphate acyltransferase [Tistrella bauzanensis]
MADSTALWPLIIAVIGGYLLGSVPFGVVLTRMAGLGDVRRIGSGNIGATNVLRTGNKPLALATLILDSGKGAAATLIAGALLGPGAAIAAAGASVLGHLFPVWLGFKGGKGVATGLGVLLALNWQIGLIACAIWLLVALVTRFSSLAALSAFAAAPVACLLLASPGLATPGPAMAGVALFVAVLVFIRHRGNIRRLLDGTEPRIGRTSDKPGR